MHDSSPIKRYIMSKHTYSAKIDMAILYQIHFTLYMYTYARAYIHIKSANSSVLFIILSTEYNTKNNHLSLYLLPIPFSFSSSLICLHFSIEISRLLRISCKINIRKKECWKVHLLLVKDCDLDQSASIRNARYKFTQFRIFSISITLSNNNSSKKLDANFIIAFRGSLSLQFVYNACN